VPAARSTTVALVDGGPTCSRLGCDELAVAVFAFDARECLVWLDPLGSGGRGAGVLCEVHADRMTPPYGWNLLDRRGAEARLWIGRQLGTPARTAPARRREHAPRSRPLTTPGPRLPFDAPAPRVGSASPPPAPEPARTPDPTRTPLLARAFEAARRTDDTE
jgi:hypothetical protein